jgi:hypothetical protein
LLRLVLGNRNEKGECLNLKTNHLELGNPEEAYVFVRTPTQRYRFKERKISVSPVMGGVYNQYQKNTRSKIRFFPGRNDAWNTCSKTLPMLANWTNTSVFDMLLLDKCT